MDNTNSNSIFKKGKVKNVLFVFDFDDTILMSNTDYEILSLLSQESRNILEPLSKNITNWAHFMQEVYLRMKEDKVELEQVKKIVEGLPLNQGFMELFQFIRQNKNQIDCLIISGANTLFLEWVLDKQGIKDLFSTYYTNWAQPCEQSLIRILPHHEHDCKNCDGSQCKRQILAKHLKDRESQGEVYDYKHILYAGDGQNDFCPATEFNESDILFPRLNFPLEKMLLTKGEKRNLKCKIHVWENGFDIQKILKEIL
jgi:pyridoxal phosphate phosphatase PHOSPHO2